MLWEFKRGGIDTEYLVLNSGRPMSSFLEQLRSTDTWVEVQSDGTICGLHRNTTKTTVMFLGTDEKTFFYLCEKGRIYENPVTRKSRLIFSKKRHGISGAMRKGEGVIPAAIRELEEECKCKNIVHHLESIAESLSPRGQKTEMDVHDSTIWPGFPVFETRRFVETTFRTFPPLLQPEHPTIWDDHTHVFLEKVAADHLETWLKEKDLI